MSADIESSVADQVRWITNWSEPQHAGFQPHFEAFIRLLEQETKEVIGRLQAPIVERFLDSYKAVLSRVEQYCVAQALSVPGRMQELLLAYYQAMGQRESGVTRMTRVLPIAIAELAPGVDEAALLDILRANLWGYEALRIQDDMLDEPERVNPEWILLYGFFERWCIELYIRHCPDHVQFFADFETYHASMNNAILADRADENEQGAGAKQWGGERAGLLKLCASSLLTRLGVRDLVPAVTAHLDASLAMRQLLDDMQDFKEDLLRNQRNSAVSAVRTLFRQHGITTPTVAQMEAGFVLLPAVQHCLSLIDHVAVQGLADLAAFPDSFLYRFMDARRQSLATSVERIRMFQITIWEELAHR